MDRDEVFTIVRDVVAASLAVKRETVTRESRLIDELGANSLDFLDMVFMLEKKLGISVREGDLELLTGSDLSLPGVFKDGFLAPETVEKLTAALPELTRLPEPGRVSAGQLFSLLTVDTLCRMVERALGPAR